MEGVKREGQLMNEGEQKIRSPDYEASLASPSPNHGHGRHGRSGVNGKRDLRCSGLVDDQAARDHGSGRNSCCKLTLLSMLPGQPHSASSFCFVVLYCTLPYCAALPSHPSRGEHAAFQQPSQTFCFTSTPAQGSLGGERISPPSATSAAL